MRWPILLLGCMFPLMALSGCLDNLTGKDGENAKPQTHEFTFIVPASSSGTVDLYEKNDGSQMRVVAVDFETPDQEAPKIPNPEIRVKEGDTVIVRIINNNPLDHTFHLHGGLEPWQEDGADFLSQMPIKQGQEYTYTFTDLKAGTYWYHCHMDGAHHIDLGMYGAFIVEERDPPVSYDRDYVVMLDEADTCHVHGNTDPVTNQEPSGNAQVSSQCYYRFFMDYMAQNQAFQATGRTVNGTTPEPAHDAACQSAMGLPEDTPQAKQAKGLVLVAFGCTEHAHGTPPPPQTEREWWYENNPLYTPQYNAYLINGKAFPDSPVFPVREGETVRFRIINVGNQWHAWHPHGHTMDIIAKDGYLLDSPYKADTLSIGPGERYDYVMTMNNPGLWMLNDQNGLAMMNDGQSPGGMISCIAYQGFHDVDAFAMQRALDCNTEAVRILNETAHDH